MTAIAIPINHTASFEGDQRRSSFGAASLSRSPFRSLTGHPGLSASISPSKIYTLTSPSLDFPSRSDTKILQSPSLPPTPPALEDQSPIVIAPSKPSPVVPQQPPLPPVRSGKIIDHFKDALAQIDVDECEAHGENAFFVCDLGEVYRQHMRWMRELGHRVQPFFGEFSSRATAGSLRWRASPLGETK